MGAFLAGHVQWFWVFHGASPQWSFPSHTVQSYGFYFWVIQPYRVQGLLEVVSTANGATAVSVPRNS